MIRDDSIAMIQTILTFHQFLVLPVPGHGLVLILVLSGAALLIYETSLFSIDLVLLQIMRFSVCIIATVLVRVVLLATILIIL